VTEELALLAAIVANPKEDAPRLVYADWLDENGQPERAEFIRVQIELAKIPDPPVDTTAGLRAAARKQQLAALLAWKSEWRGRYYDLRARQQQLLADPHNFVDWTPSVMHTGSRAGIRYETGRTVGLFGNGFESATFTRGFVSHVTCTAADWLTHADSLAWVPGATKGCPECEGDGTALALECGRCRIKSPPTRAEYTISLCCGANVEHADCAACSGSGRVPRPFPATAQPIERVTLTTWPDVMTMYAVFRRAGMGDSPGNVIARWKQAFETCWPGIVFELPGEVLAGRPGAPFATPPASVH